MQRECNLVEIVILVLYQSAVEWGDARFFF